MKKINKVLRQFREALGKADVIQVDDGPVLTSWDASDIDGWELLTDSDTIFQASWRDDNQEFGAILTKGDVEGGSFKNGLLTAMDSNGNGTKVRLFNLVPVGTGDKKAGGKGKVLAYISGGVLNHVFTSVVLGSAEVEVIDVDNLEETLSSGQIERKWQKAKRGLVQIY